MTKETAINLITMHNYMIDSFMNTLPEKLGATDGKITLDQWFKAQTLIQDQRFHEQGMAVLKVCRKAGYDVKMNMQNEKLCCTELKIKDY